jgi:N-acetylneuraminic acid mutarotase
MHHLRFIPVLAFVGLCSIAAASAPMAWETVQTQNAPASRHELAFVAHQGKLYAIGGRRIHPVEVYDPKTRQWTKKSVTPIEMHHFQAVSFGDAIYIIGAMTGGFPNEIPLDRVWKYYPATDRFVEGPIIPAERRRGGAGAVVYQGKIYIVAGITNGHQDGHVPWFDEFDPKTGQWKTLPDAPRPRDHFQAAIVEDKLYAMGGRLTEARTGNIFNKTVAENDVYDFRSNKWTALSSPIPTPRAGTMTFSWKHYVIVGGGESGSTKAAHAEIEAFDTKSGKWIRWPALQRGRHGTGFAAIGNIAYVVAGSGNRGGMPELDSLERVSLSKNQSAKKRMEQ